MLEESDVSIFLWVQIFFQSRLSLGFVFGVTVLIHPCAASKASLKIEGVKSFTYAELALVTDNFNSSTQIGQGGYGKVYKGTLGDGTVVAIKRAQEGSLQGEREFLTEIELLSRLHHRNLVSLVGFCDEEGEQVLLSKTLFWLRSKTFYVSLIACLVNRADAGL